MRFAKNFYFSKNIINKTLTLNLLSRHVYPAGIFVVTISDKEDELLTIYSSEEFQKPHMIRNDTFLVVGLARTKLSAEKLCAEILNDCLSEDKELDLYKFFGFEDNSTSNDSSENSHEGYRDFSSEEEESS